MIQPSEINNAEVTELAKFIASNGRDGQQPDWFRLFSLAVKCNAAVWDVEATLSDTSTPRREWIRRAMVVMFAEAEASRTRFESLTPSGNAISIAHRMPN